MPKKSALFYFKQKGGGEMTTKKSRGGRPPKFKTKEEIQEKIDNYFKECDGIPFYDEDGRPLQTAKGNIIYEKEPKPPTVTGLALALGFLSRQSLLEYQGKKEFSDTITRAKLYIEEYTERRLFDRDGVHGAKFSLINNFKGWSEKPEKEDEESISSNMVALAEIIAKSKRERNIRDFESNEGAEVQ